MKPKYTIIIYSPQELSQSSYIQTGLFELEQFGLIKVKVKLKIAKNLGRTSVSKKGEVQQTKQPFPKASYYKLIDHKSKEEISFAIDLYDFSNQFSSYALDNCDLVFKRNYERVYIDHLPEKHQNKLYKLGLSFRVQSEFKHSNSLFFIGLLLSNLNVSFKMDRYLFKRLFKSCSSQLNHWRIIKTSHKLALFQNFNKAKKNTILFQTRCFLREDHKDIVTIHQQRYHLIKLLRSSFPNQFKGGFIPSAMATEKYNDALTDVPSKPELYVEALKNAKIVIYTRGLANSPAWKMAEYLAQGKVIVAEPLTAELPVPLRHGKEVLFFRNDKELISNINQILENKELAETLSKNARAYFEAYVQPKQSVNRILEIVKKSPRS